jgi:hypothetical protein
MASWNSPHPRSKFSLPVAAAFAATAWVIVPIVCLLAGAAIDWGFYAVLGLMAGAAFGRAEA